MSMETHAQHLFLEDQYYATLGSGTRTRLGDPVQWIDLADQRGICIMAYRYVIRRRGICINALSMSFPDLKSALLN